MPLLKNWLIGAVGIVCLMHPEWFVPAHLVLVPTFVGGMCIGWLIGKATVFDEERSA